MSLKQQLVEEMKQAMKSGDKVKLDVIRFLRSQIKNYEIDHGEPDQAGLEKLVVLQAKQIKESIDLYGKGGRDDLVLQEKEKLAIIEQYLPAQLSDEELVKIVKQVVGGLSSNQPGPAIGQVMKKVQGRADGKKIAQLVNDVLTKSNH